MSDVEWKDMGLDALIKSFKERPPEGRVGVLAGKNAREGVETNASIGLKHEFGDPSNNLPMRSFLRIPITENMEKYLIDSGLFTEDSWIKEIMETKSLMGLVTKITILGESIVLDAFGYGGFGKWKALSPATLARKKNDQILVETQQLRNSISSEVV